MKQPRSFSGLWVVLSVGVRSRLERSRRSRLHQQPRAPEARPRRSFTLDSGPIVVFTEDGAVTIDGRRRHRLPVGRRRDRQAPPRSTPSAGRSSGSRAQGSSFRTTAATPSQSPPTARSSFRRCCRPAPRTPSPSPQSPPAPSRPAWSRGGQGILTSASSPASSSRAPPRPTRSVGRSSASRATDAGAPSTGLVLTNPDGRRRSRPAPDQPEREFRVPHARPERLRLRHRDRLASPRSRRRRARSAGARATVVSGAVNSAVVNCATNSYVVGGNIGGPRRTGSSSSRTGARTPRRSARTARSPSVSR